MSRQGPPLGTTGTLWPGGRLTRRPGATPALLVLPGPRRPRVLLPTGVPGASVMLRRHSTSRRQTLGQDVLAWGVRTGLLQWLPVQRLVPGDAEHVEAFVRERVPGAARVGVLLGPPRANAKPVLQVFGDDGTTIAFGKVGHDEAAAALVEAEADVLADPALGALTTVSVPELLGLVRWDGRPVLLMSAMSGSQSRAGDRDLPVAEMREVAESAPVEWSDLTGSTYWTGLLARAADVPTGRTRGHLQRLAATLPGHRLGFGRWHGDWAPWNSARVEGHLQLWDWEQSACSVPLGLDAVHFVVQEGFRRGSTAEQICATLPQQVAPVLGAWYADEEPRRATLALYVAEIGLRYERQALAGTTPQLATRLTVLDEVAGRLAAHRSQEGVR